MTSTKQNSKISLFFLLAIANLLAAFGGGSILHRALAEVLEKSAFTKHHGDEALIALMIGTVIGLVLVILLEVIKSKWRRISRTAGGLLCFGGALISILLVPIYRVHVNEFQHNQNHEISDGHFWLFYLLLSGLFSLLFVPRILRSDIAAGDKQKIGWVEFCYSAGMVMGILAWTGITKWQGTIAFETVLYMNAGFQISAGLLDIFSSYFSPATDTHKASTAKTKAILPLNWSLYSKVTIAAIALIIGIQVVSFEFRSALEFPVIAFASFYFGTAVAALTYSMIKTKLELPCAARDASGFLTIHFRGKTRRVPFTLFSILAALPLLLAVAGNLYRLTWACSKMVCPNSEPTCLESSKICPVDNFMVQAMLLLLMVISAFLFEWVVLALLDFIGLEAREKNREGLVAMTFGLMGIGAAVSIGLFNYLGIQQRGHYVWLIALVVCVIVASISIRMTKRRAVPEPSFN
jgi:hypothetical protein